jgi:hypothetical protein
MAINPESSGTWEMLFIGQRKRATVALPIAQTSPTLPVRLRYLTSKGGYLSRSGYPGNGSIFLGLAVLHCRSVKSASIVVSSSTVVVPLLGRRQIGFHLGHANRTGGHSQVWAFHL